MGTRLIMVKSDGSVSVHADDRAYKPLNWMNPPCTLVMREADPDEPDEAGLEQVWTVANKDGDTLQIAFPQSKVHVFDAASGKRL